MNRNGVGVRAGKLKANHYDFAFIFTMIRTAPISRYSWHFHWYCGTSHAHYVPAQCRDTHPYLQYLVELDHWSLFSTSSSFNNLYLMQNSLFCPNPDFLHYNPHQVSFSRTCQYMTDAPTCYPGDLYDYQYGRVPQPAPPVIFKD